MRSARCGIDASVPEPGAGGALVQCSRIETSRLVELHIVARPDPVPGGFAAQARSMYERFLRELRSQGATPRDVVTERIFLGDIGAQAGLLATLRREFYGARRGRSLHPAASCVRQAPARPGQLCELQAFALRPRGGARLPSRNIEGLPGEAAGRVVDEGGLRHVFLSGVVGGRRGDGLGFPGQAASMFLNAEAGLERAGLAFRNAVRAWIHLADIGRDYADLNSARRRFLATRGVDPPPASTCIGGSPDGFDRACGLDIRAIGGAGAPGVSVLNAPTMNEAPTYGSDFSRGMRVDLAGRSVLYVSGTASIDDRGRVVHPGDIDGQVDRMLLNIEALLAGQKAGYADVVCATTYLKKPGYAPAFRRVAGRRGFPARTPNTLCQADVCRPEWLCEMEVTAVLK